LRSRADQHQVRRWQEAVANDPASTSFLPLAEVYRREGRLGVARRLLARGLRYYPQNVDAHFLLGRLCGDLGDVEEAMESWEEVLRLDGGHLPTHRALGFLHMERGDWHRAAIHLERVEEAGLSDGRVESALAMARRQRNGSAAPPAAVARSLEVAVAEPFRRFQRDARVRRILLCDSSGRVLAQTGFGEGMDVAAVATLGAGIQSASAALAGMLGQRRFEQLYQGAGEHQLFLAPVPTPAGEMILLLAFGSETTIGLVRVLFRELARELSELPLVGPASPAPQNAEAFEARLLSSVRLPTHYGASRSTS
jgi:tetratricopeptide (TPR) repeat protein